MPAIFGRLPVRVSVGDGKPQDIGVWEITGKGENGQLTISTAAFAEVLREAANNLAPDPALSAAYRERARLVAYLATQHPAVLAYADPDEPEWAVVYVHTPAGQMSWHIAPGDDHTKYEPAAASESLQRRRDQVQVLRRRMAPDPSYDRPHNRAYDRLTDRLGGGMDARARKRAGAGEQFRIDHRG